MKRRFTFKLARLLRVRSIQEEVARGEWAAAQAAATQAEAHLGSLTEQLREDRLRLGTELLSTSPGAGVLSSHTALDAQLRGLEHAAAVAQETRAKAEELILIWQGREQERRSLTELAERGRRHHKLELDRAEESARDDTFLGHRSADSQAGSSADLPQDDGERGTGTVFPPKNWPRTANHKIPR